MAPAEAMAALRSPPKPKSRTTSSLPRLSSPPASASISTPLSATSVRCSAGTGLKNELVVCQELRDPCPPGVQVSWTEEDLDTLRHEAHHLVQDCRDTYLNGRLDAVYTDPIGLAKSWLGERRIMGILNAYSDASDHIKVMELEAFSVAAMNDPAEQVRDIQNFCF